jgi:alkanesulfonate monooxygenase SsuD/methylene tetrahydromethanopterin reductase-like flavin-dependent oxidoreductase (luciferase family)
LQRTEWNARDTDATVIFTLRPELSGGSKRTADFAAKHGKPWLHISAASGEESANTLRGFLERHNVGHLNVAGSRASKEPEVYDLVMQTLAKALFPNEAA